MYRLSFEEGDFSGGAGGFSAAVATAIPLIKKIDNCIANRESIFRKEAGTEQEAEAESEGKAERRKRRVRKAKIIFIEKRRKLIEEG